MNGVINIHKPKGFTSHDVVARLRRILSMKKIGHTGTLDPDATGVLPICVGRATKGADMLTATEKEYIAKVQLGVETDTQDASGTVLRTAEVKVSEGDIQTAAQAFVGDILQIPPMYSAIKQNGKKLYELARAGQTVERKPRSVTIDEIEILEINIPENWFTMRVACSKGTYIRTLCQDIGEKLGCFAHMAELCRTKSGRFSLNGAVTLEEVESLMEQGDTSFLTPIDQVFQELPDLTLSKRKAELVKNGVRVSTPGMEEGITYRVYDEMGNFLTISHAQDGVLVITKTFYQE